MDVQLLVRSQLDLHWSFRCVDAGTNLLAVVSTHIAVAQVADLARHELADARVADALAASVGQVETRVFAGDEDGLRPVGLHLAVGLEELDRAALAGLDVALDLRLK